MRANVIFLQNTGGVAVAGKNNKDSLSRDLKMKGILIPLIFAVAVVIICTVAANAELGFLPNGTHDDALTTTAATEKTEFDENEYARITKD